MRPPKNGPQTSSKHYRHLKSREGGFTLVEILIALALMSIITAAVYQLYISQYKTWVSQDLITEMQQNARVSIDTISRDLLIAGYRVSKPIATAGGSEIAIRFFDVNETGPDKFKEVSYRVTSNVLYRSEISRNADTDDAYGVPSWQPLSDNVTGLAFTYFRSDGTLLSTPVAVADLGFIYRVKVSLTVQTSREDPITLQRKTFTLSTDVRPRNIGIGGVAADTTPPAPPTGLQVIDPGRCGTLRLRWDANAEVDLSGYTIYYGTKSRGAADYTGYIGRVSVGKAANTEYDLTGLTTTLSNAATPTMYYITLVAYDTSGNVSGYSAEVSGNPVPSIRAFGGGNDTTINIAKTAPATSFKGEDGTAENTVKLTWTPSADPNVNGYRIYRGTQPFSSYPITPGGDVTWIAGAPGEGKPELGASANTFTDTGPSLIGCQVYYYAIAPVTCDATLITDDAGDDDTKRYVQSDYAVTYGDGTGSGTDSPAGSDTAPPDNTNPAAPVPFSTRAGYKRVAVSFTQPVDADLKQTCIYAREGSDYPALLGTKDALGCLDVTPGIRLYESDGVFTTGEVAKGQSYAFWHNSMAALTDIPSLAETGTYSYRALSVDICGRTSAVTGAQATTTLCGEDPTGKPKAVSSPSASGCAAPVTLTWTPVPSNLAFPSGVDNPYDLAGYRIFRSTSATDWSSSVLLNTAPLWGSSYSDVTGVTEGGPYYYRIVSTDCPYEKGDDTGGVQPTEGQIRNHMNTGFLTYAQVGPVYPGQIVRDEKCPGGGTCTKDLHREVLTGVTLDGSNNSSPSTDFAHNTVTLFFENTSGGDMTVQGANISWTYSSALLTKITIGGGRSGLAQVYETTVPSASFPATVSLVPQATIGGLKRYVPITFEFKDSGGNPVDTREDMLRITLNIRNESTGSTTCRSYLTTTVPQALGDIAVPLGPSVTATQQNKPTSPTFGYAVPPNTVPSGSNGPVVVDSGASVAITTSVTSNTVDAQTGLKVGIASVRLYYMATANTVTTPPTAGYTEVAMTDAGGGNWTGTIPANDGMRVWYYVVATDSDGNYDRDPETGAFTYDQKVFNPCDYTPMPPAGLAATVAGSSVTLNWTPPTLYTSGSDINPADSRSYRIFRNGVQIGTDQTGTTYTDSGLASGVYSYYVKALNSCPNVSDTSNTASACVGIATGATLSVSPTSIYKGDSYTVTIVDCRAISGGLESTTETINLSPNFSGCAADGYTNCFGNKSANAGGSYYPQVPETGPATGTFVTTVTTGAVADIPNLIVGNTDTISVYYYFAGTDAASRTRTISVVPDPCGDTPRAPSTLSGSVIGEKVTLTWSAVNFNTDGSPITDLANYKVYEKVCKKDKPNCTGSDIEKDWYLRDTVDKAVTSKTYDADQGSLGGRIYYFRVSAIDSCSIESAYSPEWNEIK